MLTRDLDRDTQAMSDGLRRTVTSHKWRPGRNFGGWVRTPMKTRVNFYFVGGPEGSKMKHGGWNALNKADLRRRGSGRIVWLGVGGKVGKLIGPAIDKWAKRALEGRKFDDDTKQKARSGI